MSYEWFVAFRSFIDRNLNGVLIVSVLIGLFLPGVESVPDVYVPYILGVMVFFLCAKITMKEIQGLPIREALLFYVLRFICFPVGLYAISHLIVPEFAVGILLIALMPVGVTTPTLVGTLQGSVALAFVLTVVSNLLAPFVIPLAFLAVEGSNSIEIASLSYTLFSVIFIPSLIYFLLNKAKPALSSVVEKNSSFVPVILLGVIIAIVIAKQKYVFFSDMLLLTNAAFFCCLLFFTMYLFGWLYHRGRDQKPKVTYSLCSGANNNALAISLALVYFPTETIFFVIVSQLIWVVAIPIFNSGQKRFFKGNKVSEI
jgi:predicted Na+-dependent transporter